MIQVEYVKTRIKQKYLNQVNNLLQKSVCIDVAIAEEFVVNYGS